MKQIAVFTSGFSRGSNFLAICEYIRLHGLPVNIRYLFVTDRNAPIIEHAQALGIEIVYYDSDVKLNDFLVDLCEAKPVDLIVLAGFMRKFSSLFFQKIDTPIVNIHPALLPKYGGKGMFGMNVHRAVFEAGEKVSGATVHFVNENYDEGEVILQKECDISMCGSAEEVGKVVLGIEHEIYPMAIWGFLKV